MANELTADQVHAAVHDLRATAAQPPEKIELGKNQREAILAATREAAGMQDVGELREFQGLPVIKSNRVDHIKLLATGDSGEDVEVPAIETAPTEEPGGG